MVRFITIILFLFRNNIAIAKYMEGEIKTMDNWAFLARFCFLSEEGEWEYSIEFDEDQGTPNLLLYYDSDDQWPAVYKTSKTCKEKEAVLSVEQNQIVNLTMKDAYWREFSGCMYKRLGASGSGGSGGVQESGKTTPGPKYTLILPTIKKKITKKPMVTTTPLVPTTVNSGEETTIFTTITNSKEESITGEDTTQTPELTTVNTEFSTMTDDDSITTTTITTMETPLNRSISISKRAVRSQSGYYHPPSRTIICHNARRFRSSRQRWWFIAISNCNGSKGINVKYKLLMTNGPPGDYWHEHFSADEFYILPVLMAFAIVYSFLMLGIIICSIELKSRQLLHTTYKIFCVSVVFQLFGIIFSSAAFLRYAVNGFGGFRVRRLGFIFMGASETLFLLLLLLLAKGFTITRGRLPLPASVKLTIFMCLYVVTYISIFIYEANVFDPGQVLYLYESPAGYGLIILRMLAWAMFIYSTVFTVKHYPEKSNFYYPFNVCGTLWFVAGPIFILSANTYIDKWVRESVVCAVLQFITFGGHLMFLILTMPSVANKNFPYHVRTTQIGIMELSGMSNGNGTNVEQFNHHMYEPTSTNIREQTLIVPLTRRTEEIFEGIYSHTARNPRLPTAQQQNPQQNQEFNNTDMENVMNWSLAKNVAALEVPKIEHLHRGSFGSLNTDSNSFSLSRRASEGATNNHSTSNGEIDRNNFQDYVRDVPIELFTISRMIVATNRHPEQH